MDGLVSPKTGFLVQWGVAESEMSKWPHIIKRGKKQNCFSEKLKWKAFRNGGIPMWKTTYFSCCLFQDGGGTLGKILFASNYCGYPTFQKNTRFRIMLRRLAKNHQISIFYHLLKAFFPVFCLVGILINTMPYYVDLDPKLAEESIPYYDPYYDERRRYYWVFPHQASEWYRRIYLRKATYEVYRRWNQGRK